MSNRIIIENAEIKVVIEGKTSQYKMTVNFNPFRRHGFMAKFEKEYYVEEVLVFDDHTDIHFTATRDKMQNISDYVTSIV